MTEFEACKQFQDLVKQMNRVKIEYDRNYMFYPRSFYNQYMAKHMGPLFERASALAEYIPEETLDNLQVEELAWTGQNGTMSFSMWVYFFNNWENLSR